MRIQECKEDDLKRIIKTRSVQERESPGLGMIVRESKAFVFGMWNKGGRMWE